MSHAIKTGNAAPVNARWFELQNRLYPLYPIRSTRDHKKALDAANMLIGNKLISIELKYLDALTTLIEAYETAHVPLKVESDPIKILEYLCKENGLSASDLGRILGDRSLGSRILSGNRQLSKSHIAKLCKRFAVEPGLFFCV